MRLLSLFAAAKDALNSVVLWLVAALALVLSVLFYGRIKQRDGKNAAVSKAKEDDATHAEDIRNRVDRNLDIRVRELDDAGYRD